MDSNQKLIVICICAMTTTEHILCMLQTWFNFSLFYTNKLFNCDTICLTHLTFLWNELGTFYPDKDATNYPLLGFTANVSLQQRIPPSQSLATSSEDVLPVLELVVMDNSSHINRSRATRACECSFELGPQVYRAYIMQIIYPIIGLNTKPLWTLTLNFKGPPTYCKASFHLLAYPSPRWHIRSSNHRANILTRYELSVTK